MTRRLARLAAVLLALHVTVLGVALAAGTLPDTPRRELAFYAHRAGLGRIVLLDVDRGLAHTLLRYDSYVVTLSWSPDGDRLAFIAYDNIGVFRIYVLDIPTRRLTTPTNQVASNETLVWSPNGRWIAFNSYLGPYPTTYILDAVSLDVRWLQYAGMLWNSEPTWSPDGAQLAFTGRGESVEVYVVEVDCSRAVCAPHLLVDDPGSDRLPAWSPVDGRVAFVSDRGGRPAIYLMDSACVTCGPQAQHIADLSVAGTHLAWSPDGRYLAFTDVPRGGNSAVYVVDVSCEACAPGVQALSQPTAIDNWPSWSPDGRTLAFISRHINVSDIAVLDMGCLEQASGCGGHPTLMTLRDSIVWSPSWRPGR
ncbi:MAG: hypothetical protein K8J31_24810 [Anaerolineae bacterium]|nr:hypothetical protein [Anaerolineae bacterium]